MQCGRVTRIMGTIGPDCITREIRRVIREYNIKKEKATLVRRLGRLTSCLKCLHARTKKLIDRYLSQLIAARKAYYVAFAYRFFASKRQKPGFGLYVINKYS